MINKNNIGFTLIELLAVIVILAIISLIATPLVLNIISDTKDATIDRSIELYKNSVEDAFAKYQLKNTNKTINNGNYKVSSDGKRLKLNDTMVNVEYDGTKLKCDINYNNGKIAVTNCLQVEGESYLVSGNSFRNKLSSYRENIVEIKFLVNDKNVYESIIDPIDLSEKQDGSVLAYITEIVEGEVTKYKVNVVTQSGMLYANKDSSNMFKEFKSLTSIDLSNLDTSKVENMTYMFCGCLTLTNLDLSAFDTSKVKNMSRMFIYDGSLVNIDVSSFDTSEVTNMMQMFQDCNSLKKLDLSNFNTSKVENMSWMFYGCGSLKELVVLSFDTANVTDMSCMFGKVWSLKELDLSSFNTSKVEDMDWMFYYDSYSKIYVSELWDTTIAEGNPFVNCGAIKGAKTCCSAGTGVDMANYETGYLTYKAHS